MDPEKFDDNLVAYLFDELEEPERAAFDARLESNGEARDVIRRYRGTLALTEHVLEEPSTDLDARILAATEEVERGEPWHRKLVKTLAWAGSHAMRPQFAMGTLLVMLLGSSLLLLRAKPGAMHVTAETPGQPLAHSPSERGDGVSPRGPEEAGATAAPGRPQAAASSAPRSTGGAGDANVDPAAAIERGTKLLDRGQAVEARREFAAASAAGGKEAGRAALLEARAAKVAAGCKEALPLFQSLRERFGSSGYGADACFDAAVCLRELGDPAAARELLGQLTDNPEYREQARAELARSSDAKRPTKGKGVAAGAAPTATARTASERPTGDERAF